MKNSKNDWESTNSRVSKATRKILNEYLLSIKLANKSMATIKKYRWLLERFLIDCKVPLDELTSSHVLNWYNKFCKGKKAKTMALYLSILSSFFTFCLDEEYVDRILIKRRWRPSIPYALPKFLSEQEYAQVKLMTETMPLRDRALVLFLFSSGCRSLEVVHLKIQDVDLKKRTAQVTGKGKKIRKVHFSEECSFVLQDYLSTRTYIPNDPLFMNKFGQSLQKNGIYLIIKKLGKIAELPQSLHPHVCRHTFATNLLARGAELEFIADELGHVNLNTTRVYARIPTEDMRIAYHNIMG